METERLNSQSPTPEVDNITDNHFSEIDEIKLAIDQMVQTSQPQKTDIKINNSLLKRLIFLKPHNNELLTANAAAWLFISRIVIFLMALAEAFSWGYLGYLLVGGNLKYLSAFVVGTIIFLIVWAADVSLMTLDRSQSYQEKIFGDQETKSEWTWLKGPSGVLFRIIFVSISLYITAPFLSQLIFNTPIENDIEKKTNILISQKRDALLKKQSDDVEILNKQIRDDQKQLEDEIAGRLKSKQYGDGPVAKAIREKITKEQQELEKLKNNEPEYLLSFDKLVEDKNYDLLSKTFGISLPKNDIKERNIVIGEILTTEEGKKTDLTIKAFLFSLFLVLMILKIWEPRGVRIYFSEALHQAWKGYMKGTYDQWVPTDERWKSRASMEPYRFEDFMINIYAKKRLEDEKDKLDEEFKTTRQKINDFIFNLEAEREKEIVRIRPLVAPLHSDLAKVQNQMETTKQKIISINHQILQKTYKFSMINADLTELNKSEFSYTTNADLKLGREIAEAINRLKSESESNKKETENLELNKNKESEVLSGLVNQKNRIEERISNIESYASEIEMKIREITKISVKNYADRARNIAESLNNKNQKSDL